MILRLVGALPKVLEEGIRTGGAETRGTRRTGSREFPLDSPIRDTEYRGRGKGGDSVVRGPGFGAITPLPRDRDRMIMGRGYPGGPPIRGPRDRGGYNEGAAWNRRPARRDMDIVDRELNRYQPAFDKVQRYPEGFGGQPVRGGIPRGEMPRGEMPRGGRRGGGDRSGQIDRLIGAIEGMGRGGGGNVTNTFNPTFNPTNVNAGRDIRDTAILGGDNTAGRDIVGAGSGDVETGDGGGGNTVNTNPVNVTPTRTPDTTPPVDTTPPSTETSKKVDNFLDFQKGTLTASDKTASEQPDYQSPYYTSAQDKATQQAATLFTGNTITGDDGNTYDEMISGSDFTGGGGAVTQESLGKEADDPLNFVQQSYKDVFGRLPDQEGYDYFTSELNTGSLDKDSFLATLQGSSEAKERDISGQGGTGLLYEKVDDYLAGGGQGGTPSNSAYIQDDDVPAVNTTEYILPEENTGGESNTYGGGTAETNYITDQDAYKAEQTARAADLTNSTTTSKSADDYLNAYANLTATESQPASNTIAETQAVTDATTNRAIASQQKNAVDSWLTDLYSDLGINDGVVDQEGRDYWTSQLGNKSKAEVERDIKYAAANN